MKYLVILGDGMSDRPLDSLGGRTPLEVARIPTIHRLCREGRSGLFASVPLDMPPGSEVANLAVLGYDVHRVYEGRGVLGTIRDDADSKNIEELDVVPDPDRFQARKSEEELAALDSCGVNSDYDGMMQQMATGAMVVDDISHKELETLIEAYKPAVVCSGIKDKYVVEKMGVPCKQLHNYDYGGPYAGFKGAVTFYHEIDRMVNADVWRMVSPPWATPVAVG